MTTRKKLLAGAAVLAFLAGRGAWAMYCCRTPDPLYEGMPLSAWLAGYCEDTDTHATPDQTDTAVRHAGTNAIPLLLRLIQARDSALKLRLMDLADKLEFISYPVLDAEQRHYQAECAFRALGPTGRSAVPALLRMYREKPILDSKIHILSALGAIGYPTKDAISLLVLETVNTNSKVRNAAIRSLGQMRANPELIVPVLIKSLNDPTVQLSAISALGQFGPQARLAVPRLIEIYQRIPSSARRLEYLTTDALIKIDPEAASKAGIDVTNPPQYFGLTP